MYYVHSEIKGVEIAFANITENWLALVCHEKVGAD
jgi:hypothetical protein